jgi:EAL domain-containing protein (putative c-di-GMP-specific phosphodiesterase class I)
MPHEQQHKPDLPRAPATSQALTHTPEPGEQSDAPRLDPEPDYLALRNLLDSGGPSIVYQTITHIETGKVLGAEALSRFPAGFSPRQWFELANAVNLGAELDTSAALTALSALDVATRRRLGWEFVGINLSPQTLRDSRFNTSMAGQLGRHVALEFTDQRERPDWPTLRTHIDRARDLGARIAVNALTWDPGTQMQRLIELAPDIVKLDASYTATLVGNRNERRQAEEFLLNCTRSGMFIVGVGVEKPADLDILREFGVEAAQGYLFGQPRSLDSHSNPTTTTMPA